MAKKASVIKIIIFIVCAIAIVIYGFNLVKDRLPRKLVSFIAPTKITVMTYDINYGMGMDNIYSLSRIAKIIRSGAPHLVILNEVDYKTKRGFNDEQARRLAADLGMEFTFARNYEIDSGWTGNAILSKFPIEFAENKVFKHGYAQETKSLLHIIIKTGNDNIHLFGTELSADTAISSIQAEELVDFVFEWDDNNPIVVGGNFGLSPDHKLINEMTYYYSDVGAYIQPEGFTYPSYAPGKRIDYLFANKYALPVEVSVLDNELTRVASDHLPLVAQFKIHY